MLQGPGVRYPVFLAQKASIEKQLLFECCHVTFIMTVVRRPARVTQSCPTPGSGDFWDSVFEPSKQTVLKSESTRRVMAEHFQALIDDCRQRRERYEKFQEKLRSVSEEHRQELIDAFTAEESQISRISRSRMKEGRFQRIRLIGRGGFGEVYLVQDKLTYEYFALKVLSKADVILQDQLSNVRTERDVLSSVDNQWVVQLHASFQDSMNLYLVLEYVPGGDLMTAMMKVNIFPEATARFFAGEIALALQSVHKMNVIHRDLKLENILLCENGHIKLTDFGLSVNYEKADGLQAILAEVQELMNEHYKLGRNREQHVRGTDFGTYGYTAPEILRGDTPTTASDFWSLGVILYEMLYGFAPFNGKSPRETVFRVLHYNKALRFPSHAMVSPDAKDLLKHLLCEPEVRYGFDQLVTHPFFKGFDFDHVEANIPPLVPVLLHPADTQHFDHVDEKPADLRGLPDDDLTRAAFMGFTFKQKPRNMTLARMGIFA